MKAALLVCGLSLLTAACASSPIGVERVDPRAIQRSISTSVVANGEPSHDTRIVLEEEGLTGRFEDDPAAALGELRAAVVSGRRGANALFALAELSFLHADSTGDRRSYLAAAVYAWTYLFPGDPAAEPSRFDRRLRGAVDLYNRAIAEAFKSEDGAHVVPRSGVFPLPFGEMEVTFDASTLAWRGRELGDFVSVADLEVRGLRARYRHSGLGAPLAASVRPIDPSVVKYDLLGPRVKIGATALLTMPPGRDQLRGPRLRGTLTLHVAGDGEEVRIEGRTIPLELDPTAAVAYALTNAPIWDREFGGFFRSLIPDPGARAQLGSIAPYQPGLIPVVFVHGTASSPARWAQMYNRLANSARIRGRYQFWFFFNTTPARPSRIPPESSETRCARRSGPWTRTGAIRRSTEWC